MAPKQARALAKAKELQTAETPLVRRLKNIKNAKVHEGSWQKLWTKMQEWAYVNKKPTQAVEKIKYSTIFSYVNAPLMPSFNGTKETAVKFIIRRVPRWPVLLRPTGRHLWRSHLQADRSLKQRRPSTSRYKRRAGRRTNRVTIR